MTRLSIVKLKRLEAVQARRDGTDGKPQPMSPATAEALREELMFGRPGPLLGSGPNKAKLMALFVENMGTGAARDSAYKDRLHALGELARAHYCDEHGLPHVTAKADIRKRVDAFYAPRLRAYGIETP